MGERKPMLHKEKEEKGREGGEGRVGSRSGRERGHSCDFPGDCPQTKRRSLLMQTIPIYLAQEQMIPVAQIPARDSVLHSSQIVSVPGIVLGTGDPARQKPGQKPAGQGSLLLGRKTDDES